MTRSRKSLFLLIVPMVLSFGCGEEKMIRPELVTISGRVVNIDTGAPAAGVRVFLLDTDYRDNVVTGSDGAYSISVPKGTDLMLVTDDFTTTGDDAWFPLINVDLPAQAASEDISNWVVHSCPNTHAPEVGSVAAWDSFLGGWDDDHGDRYVPSSAASSSGIIAVLIGGCEGTPHELVFLEDIQVTTNSPAFPVSYVDGGKFPIDPDFVYPPTHPGTDASGIVYSWGDPSFAGDSVTLTVTDLNAIRGLQFTNSWVVPVRPGTITACITGSIDGVAPRNVNAVIQCFGQPKASAHP